MNCFYIDYFKDLRNASAEAISVILGAEAGASKNTKMSRYNRIVNQHYPFPEEIADKLGEFFKVSPHWFTIAPNLLTFGNLFYYLLLGLQQLPGAVLEVEGKPESRQINDSTLEKYLEEYNQKKYELWDKKITEDEWHEYQYNCLKRSDKFVMNSNRMMIDYVKSQNIKIPVLAKALSKDLHSSEELTLRALRKALNSVGRPSRSFIKAFCNQMGLIEDDWDCEFYFSAPEDYFNLFVVADVMICPFNCFREKNLDNSLIVAFDRETFMNAWMSSKLNEDEEVNAWEVNAEELNDFDVFRDTEGD